MTTSDRNPNPSPPRIQYRDFVLRPWEPRDRAAVGELVRTVLTEYGLGFEPDATDRDALQVETAYWQTGGEFWVVERQGEIVGSGGFHPTERGSQGVELRKMFLLPEVRGQGLGRYLLQMLEAAAARRGFRQMWLETATVLKEAVRLYEQCGYQIPTDASVHVARCDRIYVKTLNANPLEDILENPPGSLGYSPETPQSR